MENTIIEARKIGAIQTFTIPILTTFDFSTLRWFFVLDFESTCFAGDKTFPAEIIEFPVVVLDSVTGNLVDSFESFVKPTEYPNLSSFCSDFTGILQTDIENAPHLNIVLRDFEDWLKKVKESLGCSFKRRSMVTAIFVTWTDWDISTCLWDECRRKKLPVPGDMLHRIDLKAIFQQWISSNDVKLKWKGGLQDALNLVGLKFEGRPHRGIIDAKNTARLLMYLITKNIFHKTI